MKASTTVLAALAITLTLSNCSSTPTTPEPPAPAPTMSPTAEPTRTVRNEDGTIALGSPGVPEGGSIDPATVDEMNADEVTDAAVFTFETLDTRLDLTPDDGPRRAVHWLTPELAARVLMPVMQGGGAAWNELGRHDGYTTVEITDATMMGQPEDTATEAYRSRGVHVTWTGRDGWTGEDVDYAYYVYLVRADETSPWRITKTTLG